MESISSENLPVVWHTLNKIELAISLIRGVSSVTLKRRRKTSMDRAIEDIEQGRVYKYDSLDDLIKEIEG